ncbi:MAG: sporulation protein YtfJ [Clostridia bacterium]|nr:sporulation protein YtfJ [Clostridia bacterium]
MNNNNEMPLKQIIDSALSKIGEVVDVNTVIGEPINLPGDVSIIPFSKVTVGFASGGAEYSGKTPRTDGSAYFAGGNGAGVSMVPLGFIAVEKGAVRVIELGKPETYASPKDPINQALDGINGVIDKTPELLAKLMAIFGNKTEETVEAEMVVETPSDETDIEIAE